MIRPPRYVAVVVAVAVLSLVIAVAVAWQVARQSSEEEQRDCERSAQVREDNRAMWIHPFSRCLLPIDDTSAMCPCPPHKPLGIYDQESP